MKEILAELYNKVASFFLAEKSENTKDIASNRLKLVLMHDRTKLDPLTLEKMRYELIDVISKYVVIDKELLELNLAGEGDSIALMLNIPVVRAKTEEELLIEAQENAKEDEETVNEDIDDELDEALDSEDMSYEQKEPEENQEEKNEDAEEDIVDDAEDESVTIVDSEDMVVEANTEEQEENIEEPGKDKKDKK